MYDIFSVSPPPPTPPLSYLVWCNMVEYVLVCVCVCVCEHVCACVPASMRVCMCMCVWKLADMFCSIRLYRLCDDNKLYVRTTIRLYRLCDDNKLYVRTTIRLYRLCDDNKLYIRTVDIFLFCVLMYMPCASSTVHHEETVEGRNPIPCIWLSTHGHSTLTVSLLHARTAKTW